MLERLRALATSDARLLVAVPSLDEARVAYYAGRLERGGTPAAVIASLGDGHASFVLDGHHKLAAAIRTGRPLDLLEVVPLAPREASPEALARFLGPAASPYAAARERSSRPA